MSMVRKISSSFLSLRPHLIFTYLKGYYNDTIFENIVPPGSQQTKKRN